MNRNSSKDTCTLKGLDSCCPSLSSTKALYSHRIHSIPHAVLKNIVNFFKLLKSPESELFFSLFVFNHRLSYKTSKLFFFFNSKTSVISFVLSAQTRYEMHKKTRVRIPATSARIIYNVHCGKSYSSVICNLYSQ